MREDTRAFVKQLIDFYEASGRQNWTTIRHFVKVKKSCSYDVARRWLSIYNKEGMALLDRQIKPRKEPKRLQPHAVETAKRVLEVLKEDSSVSNSEGAAKLNISPGTFFKHRKRFMTPGLLTPEMKIQIGIVPGTLPESEEPGPSKKGVLEVEGLNIKFEKSELESEVFDRIEDIDGHQTWNDEWRQSKIEESKTTKTARHCLLCYIRLSDKSTEGNVKPIPIRSSSRNYKDNPSIPIVTTSVANDCGDGELGENLNAIFALKTIFGLTSADLLSFMKASRGRDPRQWYDLCESCDIILKEAIAIQHQVLQLSKELEKCKKNIKEKIEKSSPQSSNYKNGHGDLLVTRLIRQAISDGKRENAELEPFPSADVIIKTEPEEENEAEVPKDLMGDLNGLHGHESDFINDPKAKALTCSEANEDSVSVSGANAPETVDILDILRSQPVKQTVCETCGAEMPSSKLPLHALREHDIAMDGFTVFRCQKEGCKYSSLSKTAYKNHVTKVHTPYEKRKYVCKTCGKKFSVSNYLQQHEIIHRTENPRPYQCEICGSSFAAYATLYNHRRIVHEKNPAYVNRNKNNLNKKVPRKSNLKGRIRKESAVSAGKGSNNDTDSSETTTTTVTNDAPVERPATENPQDTFVSPPQPQAYDTTDAPATSTISLALMQMYSDLSHTSENNN